MWASYIPCCYAFDAFGAVAMPHSERKLLITRSKNFLITLQWDSDIRRVSMTNMKSIEAGRPAWPKFQ